VDRAILRSSGRSKSRQHRGVRQTPAALAPRTRSHQRRRDSRPPRRQRTRPEAKRQHVVVCCTLSDQPGARLASFGQRGRLASPCPASRRAASGKTASSSGRENPEIAHVRKCGKGPLRTCTRVETQLRRVARVWNARRAVPGASGRVTAGLFDANLRLRVQTPMGEASRDQCHGLLPRVPNPVQSAVKLPARRRKPHTRRVRSLGHRSQLRNQCGRTPDARAMLRHGT
jgi:hypothetical protein